MINPPLIEQLADAAWPAAEAAPLGPWKLRATRGVTRRANSVFTVGAPARMPAAHLERMIDSAERFYTERSLACCFYLSPYSTPANLEPALIRRAYVMGSTVQVWVGGVRESLKRFAEGPDAGEVRSAGHPDRGWFDCAFEQPAGKREVHEEIVQRVPAPRCFVSVLIDGLTAACGMGVSQSGHTGIFCMFTREPYRRRGLAGAALRQIMLWAAAREDRWSYLQVLSNNASAQSVYRRAGLAPVYDYHYRVKSGML